MSISSLSLDREDLKNFCDILQERADTAAEIEVNIYQQGGLSEEQFEADKSTLKESFKLKIAVTGIGGDEHWGAIEEVFNSVNFPEQVKSLYVDSESTLRYVHDYRPHNSFKIFLDFSKPKIFDLSLLPNVSTPNGSNIQVEGYDATWVNGVFSELKSYVDSRSSTLSKFHNHSVYDILLVVLGVPLSFWMCSKFSSAIDNSFGDGNELIVTALYLYTFIGTLFIFRILFHYLRWVCPLVEYKNKINKMLIHRGIFGSLAIGWIGKFMYDMATGVVWG